MVSPPIDLHRSPEVISPGVGLDDGKPLDKGTWGSYHGHAAWVIKWDPIFLEGGDLGSTWMQTWQVAFLKDFPSKQCHIMIPVFFLVGEEKTQKN